MMFGGCFNEQCTARLNLIRKLEQTLQYCNTILPLLSSDEQIIMKHAILLVNTQFQSILNPDPTKEVIRFTELSNPSNKNSESPEMNDK